MTTPILNDSMVQAHLEEENGPKTLPAIDVIKEADPILDTHASTSRETLTWKQEDTDAPKGGFVTLFSLLFPFLSFL